MKLIEPIRARVVNIPVENEEEPVKGMTTIEKVVVYSLSLGIIFAIIFVLQKLFGG